MSGRLVHFEIRAADAERAQAFWASLLGWRFNAAPGERPYTTTDAGGGPSAGLYRAESAERGLVAYFAVDDLEAAVARVGELGGSVGERGDVPGVGRFAHCVDTEGNPFALVETDPGGHGPGPGEAL